ncbi:hypothetical protein HYS10_01750 [Candidatus Collierbacteria bacterium]|nr:hypothetical protein [Candidatus Collierbacteria bacterium]
MAAPKFSKINLLPKDSFEFSSLGKIMKWSLTTGRVLVVLTEFVVILAFGSRFWYDRRLNDLMESIDQKQAVVESYAEIEERVRDVLERQKIVNSYLSNNLELSVRVNDIKRITPSDVNYSQISFSTTGLDLAGTVGSEVGFYQLISGLTSLPNISSVNVGGIEFDQTFGLINFKINASITKPKT